MKKLLCSMMIMSLVFTSGVLVNSVPSSATTVASEIPVSTTAPAITATQTPGTNATVNPGVITTVAPTAVPNNEPKYTMEPLFKFKIVNKKVKVKVKVKSKGKGKKAKKKYKTKYVKKKVVKVTKKYFPVTVNGWWKGDTIEFTGVSGFKYDAGKLRDPFTKKKTYYSYFDFVLKYEFNQEEYDGEGIFLNLAIFNGEKCISDDLFNIDITPNKTKGRCSSFTGKFIVGKVYTVKSQSRVY